LPCTRAGGRLAASSGAAGIRGAGVTEGTTAGSGGKGTLPQAASIPTMVASQRIRDMLLILLEALLAMLLLVGIVWWTMFSGRKGGEPPPAQDEDKDKKDL
jgi:hypothetical protein